MFKIGEFSKLTQVSIRMLRYYDQMGLLKPAQVDIESSYRLYSAKQIPALNRIIFLRDMGFTISEIKSVMQRMEMNSSSVIEELSQKEAEIQQTISQQQDRLARIELAKKDMLKEKLEINYNVKIKAIPSYQVFSLRKVVKDYYCEGDLWQEMTQYAVAHQLPLSEETQTLTIYHDKDFPEEDVDIEVCALINQDGIAEGDFSYRVIEAIPIMAYSMVYGPFDNISGGFTAMANWLGEHNQYEMVGETRQIVHRGPWNENNPEDYLTEIQIPLRKISQNAN